MTTMSEPEYAGGTPEQSRIEQLYDTLNQAIMRENAAIDKLSARLQKIMLEETEAELPEQAIARLDKPASVYACYLQTSIDAVNRNRDAIESIIHRLEI